MTLISCKTCDAQIAKEAKTCPQCGATNGEAYKAVRLAGLIYLGLIGLAFYWVWGLMTPEPKAGTDIAYTITQDEHREGRPRKVEVMIPRRLTDSELAEVAAAVRADGVVAERTYIGFRVEGQNDSAYWANASFDPDYRSSLIGTSAEDYQKLLSVDLSGYPEKLGSWMRDGALGHVMVLYKRDGKHFIDQVFPSGGKNTESYSAKPLADGDLRLEEPENDFGEYYVLKQDGTLQGWGENGMYMSLPKLP